MTLVKLFYFFQYFLICKFGFSFNFFFFKKSFQSFRLYSYFFDIYSDITDNIVDLYNIIYDLNHSFRKPHLLKYKYIYRGKSRVKVLIMQTKLYKYNTLSFNLLISEIFFFVLPRYFFSFLKKLYFTNLVFSQTNSFLNFTMSSFLFLYMLEDIDPVILRKLRINFSIMFVFSEFYNKIIIKFLYSVLAFIFYFKLLYS